MDAAPRPASCRYLGADATLVSARGPILVQAAAVGDWLLAGDGCWARVTHTRRVLHRGALVQIDLVGGGRIRATRALPVAVGPGHFADADRLTVGQTLLVPVSRVPDPPQDRETPHLAWLETARTGSCHRTHLRTPWGQFVAEPPARPPEDAREMAPTLAGRYRITPAGLVRLNCPTVRRRTAMSEALGRHRHAVWSQAFPPAPTLFHRLEAPPPAAGVLICEQALSCRRQGDRVEFGVCGARLPSPGGSVRALPRRVRAYGILSHSGWAFGVTLAGADTLVADGVVAAHFPQAPPEVAEADIEGG